MADPGGNDGNGVFLYGEDTVIGDGSASTKFSAYLNRLALSVSALLVKSNTRRRCTATMTVPSATSGDGTVILWDTADRANGITYAAGVFTIPAGGAGSYRVLANVVFPSNGTGTRLFRMKKGSTFTAYDSRTAVTGVTTTMSISTEIDLVAGDTLSFFARQNSTVDLNIADSAYTNVAIRRMPG